MDERRRLISSDSCVLRGSLSVQPGRLSCYFVGQALPFELC